MGTVAIADIEIMIQGKMNPGQVLRAMDAEVKRLTGK
jgi:hypothetical protein